MDIQLNRLPTHAPCRNDINGQKTLRIKCLLCLTGKLRLCSSMPRSSVTLPSKHQKGRDTAFVLMPFTSNYQVLLNRLLYYIKYTGKRIYHNSPKRYRNRRSVSAATLTNTDGSLASLLIQERDCILDCCDNILTTKRAALECNISHVLSEDESCSSGEEIDSHL